MKTTLVFALIVAWNLFRPAEGHAADAVALVTDLSGNARLTEGGKNSSLSVLTYLAAGSEIALDAGGRMVVTFFSQPNEYTFTGPATVAIQADGARAVKGRAPEPRRLADDQAAAARKFAPMQRERTAMASFEMRGSTRPEIRLLGPVNTEILSETPEFTWSTIPRVTRYRWTLAEAGGGVVLETDVDGGKFVLPAGSRLRYGTRYNWRVDCKLPSGKTAWASGEFNLIDAGRAGRLTGLRPAPGAPFSERLLFAVLLESEGLAYDAQILWRALALERPDDPSLKRWAEP